jgi:broad specificity phosphatase PhoE
VSSLHCPARVYLARHGEATYETGAVSDGDGQLTSDGRVQARRLGETLRGERIARVWTSPLARAVLAAVPPLVGLPSGWGPGIRLGSCGVVELEADGEEWQIIRWDAATYAG